MGSPQANRVSLPNGKVTYEDAFFPLTGKAKTALGVSKTFHSQRCYFPFRAPKKAMLELRLGAGRDPSMTPLLTFDATEQQSI